MFTPKNPRTLKRHADGMCSRCGHRLPMEGKKLCSVCKDKLWAKREEKNQYLREYKEKRKAEIAGTKLCSWCYKNEAPEGRTTCDECNEKGKARTKFNKALRKSKGLCHSCNNPVVPGRTSCEYHLEKHRQRYYKFRDIVLDHYGHECACCGENIKEFLGIDHIDGNGAQHRREVVSIGSFYPWLIRNNFPEGFQVLCHNCNFAKGHHRECPHVKMGTSKLLSKNRKME